MSKSDTKPRGKMSAYAFFVQTCREEHKKKHPGEQIVFADFSRRCADRWRAMDGTDKTRFDEMAEKDKIRYHSDMQNYDGSAEPKKVKRKRTKDPNAPKRGLSAFFLFCNEERPHVRNSFPTLPVTDVARELGRRWTACLDRTKYETMAALDKSRYDQEMTDYRRRLGMMTSSAAVAGSSKQHAAPAAASHQMLALSESDSESDE